jgi:hypothetical protein
MPISRTARTTSKTQPAPPTKPDTPKSPDECIKVTNEQPEGNKEGRKDPYNTQGFTPSQKLARTPPQQTARPTPLPAAPSKTAQKHTTPPNSTTAEDGKEQEEREERAPTEKPCDPLHTLRSIREKLTKNNTVKAEIIKELDEVISKMTEDKQYIANARQITKIENDIKEIKATIHKAITAKPKTWAQVAASPGNPDGHLEAAKRERLEKAKKEREKTEVTLTLRNASDDMQKHLSSLEESAIADCLQENLQDRLADDNIAEVKIRGIRKASKYILKIQCNSENDAATLQSLKWESILDGASVVKPAYGIVLNGVPKKDINIETQSQEEIRACLEKDNDIKVI